MVDRVKLSTIQKTILKRMQPGKWYTVKELVCTRSTIKALERKGFIVSHPIDWKWRLSRRVK